MTNEELQGRLFLQSRNLCNLIDKSLREAVKDPKEAYSLLIDIALTASALEVTLDKLL